MYLEVFNDISFTTDVDFSTLVEFKGRTLCYWNELPTGWFFFYSHSSLILVCLVFFPRANVIFLLLMIFNMDNTKYKKNTIRLLKPYLYKERHI